MSNFWTIAMLLLFSCFAQAKWEEDPSLRRKGDLFQTRVETFHPTQFGAGFREVDVKTLGFLEISREQRLQELLAEPADVVIGPEGRVYIVDRHHHSLALLRAGFSKTYAKVRENWSALQPDEFWRRMKEANYVFLYDENGQGPLDVRLLPTSLRGLRDDPLRSAIWFARKQGAFNKSEVAFTEFAWAQRVAKRLPYTREQMKQEDVFFKAVDLILAMAHDPFFADLPGYKPYRSLSCKGVISR